MKKKYTSGEILDMALKKTASSYYADLDKNGTVDVADARLALRREKGLESENKTEAGVGGESNIGNGGAFGKFDGGNDTAIKKELLDSVLDETGKTYDIGTDRLYNEYKREYEKSASEAAKNAYGLAAAGTGGYGSSYAASAASAAYGKYLSSLAEKLPEFAQSASKLRSDAINDKLNAVEELRKNESEAYSRYSDTVKNAWTAAENGDYSYLEALGMNTDALRERAAMSDAVTRAKYGDYSELKYMGVDTSAVEYADLLDIACKVAEKGDYSFLEALGVNVGELQRKDRLETALALAKYGDFSLLGNFSSNIGAIKEKINFTVQRGASEAYSAGGYRGLVSYLNRQISYGQITEKGKQQIIEALTGG